jgi:hypothetical protein
MFFMVAALTTLASSPSGLASTDVTRVGRLKIFFGHQSVGENLLDGVRRIAPSLAIVRGETVPAAPALVETMIGRNEDPESKVVHFARIMETLGDHVDVAMFKLCYIDFRRTTDVEALARSYARTMGELEGRYPKTRFVHVTAPLTTVRRGIKAWLGHLFGKPAWGELENERRARFNTWMRATYPAETIFDLAELETRGATGERATFELDGASIPMLTPADTTDGGQLTPEAGQRLAAAYIAFLAKLATGAVDSAP